MNTKRTKGTKRLIISVLKTNILNKQNQLYSLDEMDDQSVLNLYKDQPQKNKGTTKFHFSLKNKIGGLATALRVFQVHKKFFLT